MIFKKGIGNPKIHLQRSAANEGIPHDYTAVKAFNGEIVIAPNCLQCHAQVFEDKLYIGLGNTFVDFSDRETLSTVTSAGTVWRFLGRVRCIPAAT